MSSPPDDDRPARGAGERRIRSFVTREGRLTNGQQRSLEDNWPRFGITLCDWPLDWRTVFGRRAPRTLEIGFGAGEVLLALADRHPERDFLGIEVYRSGIARLLAGLADAGATNVRVIAGDAVAVLERAFAPASFDEVLLYFPDPWPKKRHHKRRIVSAEFADVVATVLAPRGVWRLATDWDDYAQHMRAVLDAHPFFDSIGPGTGTVVDPPRPATRFETRGERKGHDVHDLAYRRLTPR